MENQIKPMGNIALPISHRKRTGEGRPSSMLHFDVELSKRQRTLLESLPKCDSRVSLPKTFVDMTDLSALTLITGDEFALFTKGQERLVVRGHKHGVNIGIREAKVLSDEGYRWTGHTHPGIDSFCLSPSKDDIDILRCFDQESSAIYNSAGIHDIFYREV